MILIPILCGSYLLGAIPTGVIIGRLSGVDVRRHGSGNVGATNVYRVVGRLPGLFVLAVDMLKGWFPVAVLAASAVRWDPALAPDWAAILSGVAAVAGHIFNPFLQFRGGKGVATALGVLLALSHQLALSAAAVWIIVVLVTHYVSIASIAAALASPFLMFLLGLPTPWVLGGVVVSIAIIARHRENILRLMHGEENRFRKNRTP